MCHLPYLDGISAFASFLGFCVSLAYVQDTDVLMWENNMNFTTSPHLISAWDGLASTLFNTCGVGGGYEGNKTGPCKKKSGAIVRLQVYPFLSTQAAAKNHG